MGNNLVLEPKFLRGNKAARLCRYKVNTKTYSDGFDFLKIEKKPTHYLWSPENNIIANNTGFEYIHVTRSIDVKSSVHAVDVLIDCTDEGLMINNSFRLYNRLSNHIGLFEKDDFSSIIVSKFINDLWKQTEKYINDGHLEIGLIHLYRELNNRLKDFDYCNRFIEDMKDKKLQSDVIVHILSALSPIKIEIKYWDDFYKSCIENLKEEVGEQMAQVLLKVVR